MKNTLAFIRHLGLEIYRQQSKEVLCRCPWCNSKDNLNINKDTGQWRCWSGCGSGNAWTLCDRLGVSRDAVREYGMADPQPISNYTPPQKGPLIREAEIRHCHDLELVQLCVAKGLDYNALLKFRPLHHSYRPEILLPGYTPSQMDTPAGYLRVRQDGEPVTPDAKYMMVKGSVHSLLGLHAVTKTDTIAYAEGWRDALACWACGLPAVANIGGGKFHSYFLPVFEGKVVYLMFDADKPGQKYQAEAAYEINKVAKEVKIPPLPYQIEDKSGKDWYDYLTQEAL